VRKAKRGLILTTEDEADLVTFHARVLEDLKLAAATFMTADQRSAQRLLEAKRQLNAMERVIGRHHLARLETRQPGGLEASTLYLTMLRDLRRVNSHISAIAYDALGLPDSPEVWDESTANRDHGVRSRGRTPFRLARIAEPLLSTAVSSGVTNPPGNASASASVFSTATMA
jgi:phosphate uptake regulator